MYLGPLLGEGGFAFVYACRGVNEPSNQLVLKKVIIQDKAHQVRLIRDGDRHRMRLTSPIPFLHISSFIRHRCTLISTWLRQEQIEKEIRLLKVLQHPNIVRYHDDSVQSCAGRLEALILMEHCEGGSLFEAIKSQGQQRLSKDAILRVAMDVSRAVATLHHHKPLPIAHRDLKLENILLAFHHGGNAGVENRVIYKLIDFGSATEGPVPLRNAVERAVEEERLAKTTTQMYRAPEMIDLYLRRALDEKVDIWALGCVLSTVMHLVHPFQGVGNLGVLNGKRRSVPAVPGWEDLEEVVNRMLLADADARLDIDEVLAHLTCLQDAKPLPSRSCDGPAQGRERGGGRQGGDHRAVHVHSCPHEQKSTEHQILEARPLNPNSAAARRLAGRSRGHSASAPVTTETSVGSADAWVDTAKEAGSRQEGGRGKMGGFGGANLPFLEVSGSREGDAIASDLLTEQIQALDVATQSTMKSTTVTRTTARGGDNGALSPLPATSTTASTVRKPSFDDKDFMQSSSLPGRQGGRQEAGSPASFDPFANLHTRSNAFSHLSPTSPTFCSPPLASSVADKSMLAGFPSTMGQGGRVPQEDPPSFLSSTVSATPVRKDTSARTSGEFHGLINPKKDSQTLAAVTPPPKPPKPARPSLMKIPASAHDARFDAFPGVPHASLPSPLTTPGPQPPPLQVNQQFQQQQQPSSIYPALSAYKGCEWQAHGQYQQQQVTQIQQERHFPQLEKQRQTQPSTQMQWQQQQQQQQMGPCMQQQQQQQHQPQNFNPYNINNSILETSSPQKVDAWSTSPQQQPSLPLQGHLSPPPYAYFLNGRDSNDFAGNQDNNGIATAHVQTGVRSQQGRDRPQSLERPGGGQHSRGNTDGSFGGNSRHSEPVFRSSFSSASSNGSNQADAFGYNLSSTFPTTRKDAGEYSPCPKAQQEEDRDPFEI